MMSESQFWNLIADAKTAVGNTQGMPDWLEQKLLEFSAEEITDFSAWQATFMDQSNDEKLWAAGSIVGGGLGDDGFVYFQCWLIAQGETVYKAAVADPDSLADVEYEYYSASSTRPSINLEELLHVSSEALWKKRGVPRFTKVGLPPGYKPPLGSRPERTERKNIGFLKQNDSTHVAVFPKLTKRFSRKNQL